MTLAGFPTEWRVDVTVTRPVERDRHGNPLPGTGGTHQITTADGDPICLFAPRGTEDPLDRSDLVESNAVLYAPIDADVQGGDQLTIGGHPLHTGKWRVEGKPQAWPSGLEVAIIRED